MTTLSTDISVSVSSSLSKTVGLVNAAAPLAKVYRALLGNGTGAGNADVVFHATRTIAASGTDDLDLAGVLTSAFGDVVSFARVKAMIFSAAAANTNNVVVGGAATNQFNTWVGTATDKVVLRPGATLALLAGSADSTGYAVTASTGDLLRATNSGAGTSVTYDVIIVGASA